METNPIRVCELLVGLPDVNVLGVDEDPGGPIRVHVETRGDRPACSGCGAVPWLKDRRPVELVDLAAFGRRARLVWRKHRWQCPVSSCSVGSWTAEDPRIGAARLALTDRAGRWVTAQVGRCGRTVAEVARELGCDWHTVNDAVMAYGASLVDDPGRIGEVEALGLDETLFCRVGEWRRQSWSTSIVDVGAGTLLDVVEGRTAAAPSGWLADRDPDWCQAIRWATLDLSGPYRATFNAMLPDAVQVADPFHLHKLANSKLDECAGGSKTRRCGIGAARQIRCIGAAAC